MPPSKAARKNGDGMNGFTRRWIEQLAAYNKVRRFDFARRAGKSFAGDRDLYDVLGWEDHPEYEDFYSYYNRNEVAGAIIDRPADDTWKDEPEVRAKVNDDEEKTPEQEAFETQYEDLAETLQLKSILHRADKITCLGKYGVIVVGVAGQPNWSLPLQNDSLDGPGDILYLRVASEDSAEITEVITDRTNPKFGFPETYTIDLMKQLEAIDSETQGTIDEADGVDVHHSRVVHIAKDKEESEVFGRPQLLRPFNRVYDIEKLVGGAAEMTWLNADAGIQWNIDPDFEFSEDESDLAEKSEEWAHGLRRWIITQGVKANRIGGEVADVSNNFKMQMQLVAMEMNYPLRKLLGSERGEMASSQDDTNLAETIASRRENFATAEILKPLIDLFIRAGALPDPGDYEVEWPPFSEESATDIAEIRSKNASALKAAAPAGEPTLLLDENRIITDILLLEENEETGGPAAAEEFEIEEDADLEEEVEGAGAGV